MQPISEFPQLPGVTAALREDLAQWSIRKQIRRGSEVFRPGGPVDALLILLSGTLRVEQLAASGREIVLYRVFGGESCVLTAACLMADVEYSASGIAETDLDIASLPKTAFDALMASSVEFRGLIFQAYSKRITDLLLVVEEVAFRRIDIRLAGRLIDLAGSGKQVIATQQQIANELGSAREVISRQLQEFQRRQWVKIKRGSVMVQDKEALRDLARSDQKESV